MGPIIVSPECNKISMKRITKRVLRLLLFLSLGLITMAFTPIGPFKNGAAPNDWQAAGFGGQPQGLGYSLFFDVGGPMNALEGYRWNVPFITYGFDESFIRYFGPEGMLAVSNAFQILNDLPPFSAMSQDLTEFPMDITAVNYQAATLGLVDIKSQTLATLMEQLGLAKPERFVWGLRNRYLLGGPPPTTNYITIMMNLDPVTLSPSRYVNGVLYHYQIFDALGPKGNEWASAVEWYQLDPFYLPYSAVAGGLGSSDDELLDQPGGLIATTSGTVSGLGSGQYYPGLTRDDIGGLRFLYGTNNMVNELLMTSNAAMSFIVGGQVANGNSPWQPFLSNTNVFIGQTNTLFLTNSQGTNLIVQGIRPGINKFKFQKVDYDSLIGTTLIPVTNSYTDTVITNGRPLIQPVQRINLQPDILFLVGDLGLFLNVPREFVRSTTAGWQNNAAINARSTMWGPGVIQPQVQMFFSDLLPYFQNSTTGFLQDQSLAGSVVWSSFDGTTNAPAIYPNYLGITLHDLEIFATTPSGRPSPYP